MRIISNIGFPHNICHKAIDKCDLCITLIMQWLPSHWSFCGIYLKHKKNIRKSDHGFDVSIQTPYSLTLRTTDALWPKSYIASAVTILNLKWIDTFKANWLHFKLFFFRIVKLGLQMSFWQRYILSVTRFNPADMSIFWIVGITTRLKFR